MPHDTTFFAIFAMLFYIFVPQYFGYAAIALALWLGFPAVRVMWQTTRDLRDIPDAENATIEDEADDAKIEDKADDETIEDKAEEE